MAENESIKFTQVFEKGELPELDNVSDDAKIEVRGKGKVFSVDGNNIVVDWHMYEIETENKADKELRNLQKKATQDGEDFVDMTANEMEDSF